MSEYAEDPMKASKKTLREQDEERQKERELLGGSVSYGGSRPLPLIESFRWLTPDIFKTQDFGEHTVKIKGVALRRDTVSKNKRKYIEKELLERGSTLINKPFDVNHDSTKRIGNTEWVQYEDGDLEYLVRVHKEPYVTMIREHDPRIKGVSVSAHYLYNRCPECGQKFLNETDWQYHMETVHFRKDLAKEVHGLVFDGLSLVIAPEEPGVEDTTIEIYETSPGINRLIEILTQEKGGYIVKPKLRQKSNKELCEEFGLTMQQLGEPFADYTDIDDCVAKNPDKEDPAAYCATLMRKVEGETKLDAVQENRTLKEQLEDITEQFNEIDEAYVKWKKTMNEKVFDNQKKILNALNEIKEELTKPKTVTETTALAETTMGLQKKLAEMVVRIDNLEEKQKGVFKGHSKQVKESVEEYAEDPRK